MVAAVAASAAPTSVLAAIGTLTVAIAILGCFTTATVPRCADVR